MVLLAGACSLGAAGAASVASAHSTGAGISVTIGSGGYHYGSPGYGYPGWDRRGHRPDPRAHRLSPRQVATILARQGFHRVHFFDAVGTTYGATAVDRRGRRVIVTVSSRTGQVLSVRWMRA